MLADQYFLPTSHQNGPSGERPAPPDGSVAVVEFCCGLLEPAARESAVPVGAYRCT